MCETLGFYLLDKWWQEQEIKYKEKVRLYSTKYFMRITLTKFEVSKTDHLKRPSISKNNRLPHLDSDKDKDRQDRRC